MKNKNLNGKMHLEIQTHRKNPIGLIRSTYREDSKVKHQTLSRIVGLDLMQLKLLQAVLQGNVVAKSEFKIMSSKEYGASFAGIALAKELGLDKAIYSKPYEQWVKDSLAMIVGRLVNAGSKLALSKINKDSALWELCGVIDDKIDVNEHCYEAMDRLYKSQDRIQKSLVKRHLHNGSLVLYDITSSYLEGEYSDSELVEFGYNRDKKRGHEQIVISLLCSKEGCPVAIEVFAGNTKDESTVVLKIKEIKEKYSIDSIIFVGDRGMVTKAQYDKIDHQTVKTISALTHNNIKTLCEKEVVQLSFFDEKNIVEVDDPENKDVRYCLCKNPMMTEKEGKTRQALLDKTAEKLNKIASSTCKCKDSKAVRLGKVINKYNMAKFVIYSIENDVLTWSFDNEKIASEAVLDGCYIIYTDVPVNEMNAAEVVKSYKSLIKVEQAFRSLKTTKLEIRPIYHKTDDRIKCHVFICMLSYYLMWNMKRRLKPLFEDDEEGKNRTYSFDYIIQRLKSIRSETYDFNGVSDKIITTCDDEQQRIFELLKISL